MKTAKDLMKAGRVDRRGLTRLQDLGVIPRPLNMPATKGRGRRGYWPDEALETMARVKQMKASGMTYEAIAAELQPTLGSPLGPSTQVITWGQPGEAAVRLLRQLTHLTFDLTEDDGTPLKENGKTLNYSGREWFLRSLTEDLWGLLDNRKKAEKIAAQVVDDTRLGWAIELLMRGVAPVVVVTGGDEADVYITADFLVSHEISALHKENLRQRELEKPSDSRWSLDAIRRFMGAWSGCVVLPITQQLESAIVQCGISMEQFDPTRIIPSNMVLMMNAEVVVEQPITLVSVPSAVGTFAFTMSGSKPARVVAKRTQSGPWAFVENESHK